MSTLIANQFSEFFLAVHGVEPFPWQQRLMQRVQDAGKDWPQAITLPTSSGKTSCIDIALYALAAQADLPSGERIAPRRIAFVVDRRIIVDEAAARAKYIATVLATNNAPIIKVVASGLRKLAGDPSSDPLRVVTVRGGTFRDQTWSINPLQPLVLCSTVDQLGSRLLFRGYGASPSAWPIHSGLVGNDILILLDEAHIAEPFLQTANAIALYRGHARQVLPAPFRFVVMSATPPDACTDRFPSTDAELAPDRAHPVLGKRWSASKPTTLVIAEGTKQADFVDKLATKLVTEAKALQREGRHVIGILVNRVATAKRVAELLKDSPHILFTGRMRPYDRDRVVKMAEKAYHLSTSAAAMHPQRSPVFIIATQCLEVGADMDFDGLVSECASVDALRQRFGRLNRGGRPIEARGTIVIRFDQTAMPGDDKNLDPVYARALAETWAWLKANEDQLSFGIEDLQPKLDRLDPAAAAKLRLQPSDAPVMLPAHIEAWSQTSPKPHCDPEPSLFLHGRNTSGPEINLCWRLDFEAEDRQSLEANIFDRLSLCPPASAECLTVPRWAVQQWFASQPDLGSRRNDKILALDSDDITKETKTDDSDKPVFAICWRGLPTAKTQTEERSFILRSVTDLKRLKPNDTLVLSDLNSAQFWLGEDTAGKGDTPGPNLDLGDRVQLSARGRPTLRFHKALTAHWPKPATRTDDKPQWPELLRPWLEADGIESLVEDLAQAKAQLQAILNSLQVSAEQSPDHGWLVQTCSALQTEINDQRRLDRAIYHSCTGFILRSTRRYRIHDQEDDPRPDDSFSSSRSSEPVLLSTHSLAVAELAAEHARAAGLPNSIIRAFHLAGILHDIGKADPRFQAMLTAGSPGFIPTADRFLAKSARLPQSHKETEGQRKAAGYPKGGRHELLSISLSESDSELWQDVEEKDLVLHLIATHHGYCRPFAPVIEDNDGAKLLVNYQAAGQNLSHPAATGLERLDSGVCERFWQLQARFGSWGLAWLEALFRLADQQVSANEQNSSQPA